MLCFDIWVNAAFKHGVHADQCYAPFKDDGFANAICYEKRSVEDHKERMRKLHQAPVLILCDPSPNPGLDHNLDR